MSRKLMPMLAALAVFSLILAACGAGTPAGQQAGGTPAAQQGGADRQLEIFHWWTAPGEREAADAMFLTLKEKYGDIKVVENPNPGGGGVNQRVVLQSRIAAAMKAGHLPQQDVTLSSSALVGALLEGLLGPLAPDADGNPAQTREAVQTLTLLSLRALGVNDARARGLVVQVALPAIGEGA